MINYNRNEFSCEDITSNGRGDIVVHSGPNWDKIHREKRCTNSLHDGSDTLLQLTLVSGPIPEDLQDSLGL